MGQFDKMGVFLHDSPAAHVALEFAGHMARLGAKEVYCIHVQDVGPEGPREAPDLAELEAQARAVMPLDIAQQMVCEVQAGSSLIDVYKLARDKDLDLMIVGRRLPSSQSGIGAKFTRIARKAPCSVMVVPEFCRPHFCRILVAVDRSPHSKLAVEAAVALAKASGKPGPQLVALAVRSVDPRHNLAGVSFHESAETQRKYGQRDLQSFLADIDAQGVQIESLVALSDQPSQAISEVAAVRKMDIVVMGSRGPTHPAAALLGSTSELVLMNCPLPLLIVKEKGETLRLIEAIFKLD
ncbi:MAG: universal stress protein [Phycisphaerae bacterium]|nr:universal stress protein [Phycisphaerae bacterium]